MKNKRFLFVLLISLLILTTISSTNPIVRTIGDEEIQFVVPDDYDGLKRNYIAVIDAYVESENVCLNQQFILDKYGGLTDKLSHQNDELQKNLDKYTGNVKDYMKLKSRPSLYFGVGVGGLMGFDRSTTVLLSPTFNIITSKWMFGLGTPVGLTTSLERPFNFSIGLGVTASHRL